MAIDTSLLIPKVLQQTDTASVETVTIPGGASWVLGKNLSPAYPTGATLIPKGAGAYDDLAAPTAGSTTVSGSLVDNGDYTWGVSLVTDWGETKPATNTLHLSGIGSGKKGQTIVLPGYTVRADNPVRKLRLWRTISGGSQLLLVTELEDLSVNNYVDEVSDSELTLNAPTSNTSGSIGTGAVAVHEPSTGTDWTEVSYGTTLTTRHFSVDYTFLATGGTVHFAAADVGKTVTITYQAGTFLGSIFLNQYNTALANLYHFIRTDSLAEFSHSLKVDTDLTVLGNTSLTGTLGVTGATTLGALTSSSLHITGTSALDGVVTVNADLHAASTSHLNGTVTMGGNATVGGTLVVTGATTLSTTVDVLGATHLHTSLLVDTTASVSGATTLGSLTVSGASALASLTVSGGTTLGSLTAGALSISSLTSTGAMSSTTLTTSGAVTCLSLAVGASGMDNAGPATFHDGMNVTGLGGFNSGITISAGNLTVSAGASVAGTTTLALTNVNADLAVNNAWFKPSKILASAGSTAQDITSGHATTKEFVGAHNDFAGLVHFKPNASTNGNQFSVLYSDNTVHSAHPAVLITVEYNGSGTAVWRVLTSDATSFVVGTDTNVVSGDDYYIAYLVVD